MPQSAIEPTLWTRHLACVVAFLLLLGCVICAFRGVPAAAFRRWVNRSLGVLGLAGFLLTAIWWLQPERASLRESLPLQLCDLTALLAPMAILLELRALRAVLHFFAFALCSQWIFTPVTATGPETAAYWVSFALHASIFGCAIFDALAKGFRPKWQDWRIALFAGLGYIAIIIPIDLTLGANYGYVGRDLARSWTIVHALGPWPLRVVWIMALAITAMVTVKLVGGFVLRYVPPAPESR